MTNHLEPPPVPSTGDPGRLLGAVPRLLGGWPCRWCSTPLVDVGVLFCEFCDLEPLTPKAGPR